MILENNLAKILENDQNLKELVINIIKIEEVIFLSSGKKKPEGFKRKDGRVS
ncbi:hypothetical protein HMPREF1552_02404 [Leptotrichia sp. oral taxon 879 str. F0557]|nr:hypothetical protein HMPREF1552_02404 [Leptotrichia sp. oral taxon 879 str. F0557]